MGVLEDAPQFLFLTAPVSDAVLSAKLQRELVKRFPGVSVVDIRAVADTIFPMLEKIVLALFVLAGLVLLTACVMLLSTVVSSKKSRERELNLLRTLGATGSQIRSISVVEYFILSVISSGTGIVISLLLGYLLAVYVFRLEFFVPWGMLGVVFVGAVSLICGISLISGGLRKTAK